MKLQEHIRRVLREELLTERHIEIPKSEINKAGVLLDLINLKLDQYKKNQIKEDEPLIDFKDYFKLTYKNNEPINVSVGIYNDDSDLAVARMDTIDNILLINVAQWSENNVINLNTFEDMITHELVHSIDPLVRDKEIFGKYYEKKGTEPIGNPFNFSKIPNSKSEYELNYDKYRKLQHEYKAELTPLINKIKKIVKGDNLKMKLMIWVISNIKYYDSAEEVFLNTEENFRDGKHKLFRTMDDYWDYVYDTFYVIKPLTTKPTLYKKLINDLYLGINN